jgi:hypothetical protein
VRAPLVGGVAKEQLVERGASHLPGVRHRLVHRLAELDELGLLVVGRGRTRRRTSSCRRRLDLLAHAEAVEQRGIGRQERFADVKRGWCAFSMTTTSRPALASKAAIVEPAGPPPTTRTSHSNFAAAAGSAREDRGCTGRFLQSTFGAVA